MGHLTTKNLWAHKRRLVSTLLAIVLGISFLSGTLVLGDTLTHSFDATFEHAYAGTDAMVRSTSALKVSDDNPRPPIDASLLAKVSAVPGVDSAEAEVSGLGQLIGTDGKAIGGNGPPTFAGTWITDPELNPYELVQGRAPRAADEVVVNRGAATTGKFGVGDTVTVLLPTPLKVHVVGLATYDGEDSSSGSTFTAFTLAGAQQHVLRSTAKVDDIVVHASPGVSQAELAQRLAAVVPAHTEAVTGHQLVAEAKQSIKDDFLGFFKTFLVVFALVAVLVASFSIYNTFSIIVAQRSRESALLRAVGASRRQVLTSTILETLAIGVVASLLGLVAGVGVAALLVAGFGALGFDLPTSGLQVLPATGIISLSVGVIVTLLAGVLPAVRASRVPPLAALRDVAVEQPAVSKARVAIGGVAMAAGAGLVTSAAMGWGGNLGIAGIGALLTIVAMVVLGPVASAPFGRVAGALPARLRGMTGRLARENVVRSPKRTSGTAAALMVGVGVVVLFTVFAASVKESVDQSVSRSFGGDLVITTGMNGGGTGLDPAMAGRIGALDEVKTSVGMSTLQFRIGGSTQYAAVVDPGEFSKVLDLDVTSGSMQGAGGKELAVSKKLADEHRWEVGSRVPVLYTDGDRQTLAIGSIYKTSDVVGDVLLPTAIASPHQVRVSDDVVLVELANGVALKDGRAAVAKVTDEYPATTLQDRDEYIASVASSVNQLLTVIYVLLALAIVIALMGIANTLALSVHERTRELGLLRAVGQTRRQVRSMVRWESVMIALFGTAGGLGIGVFLGWAIVQAAGRAGGLNAFAVPVGQLVVIVFVGAVAGVIAALRPARRAARLDILTAIASD